MRRNEVPKEVKDRKKKETEDREVNRRKIVELEKQVKELTAALTVQEEKGRRMEENQEVLDSVAKENDDVIGLENEKGCSQVDTIVDRLLQILMNFSQGNFWPKGGDSFQTKVFQDYLEKHFDMQEFRTFLKENFKDIDGYVDRPL